MVNLAPGEREHHKKERQPGNMADEFKNTKKLGAKRSIKAAGILESVRKERPREGVKILSCLAVRVIVVPSLLWRDREGKSRKIEACTAMPGGTRKKESWGSRFQNTKPIGGGAAENMKPKP